MNYEKALKTIERILKDEIGEKICILIDGQWGIGKTYTINKFVEENNEFDLKYISVFGKENLKEIEKDIVMQMLPVQKIKDKLDNKKGLKIFGNLAVDILKQSSGIDIDFIRNISIENIKGNDNIIICIDDLERKSENIRLKDILGLVERAASNFNIILIGSLINFKDGEKEEFNNFKEKIIDYELVVDELSEITLKDIANNRLKNISSETLTKVIATFKNNKLEGEYLLNNLRIYKKYIGLLYKMNCEITKTIDSGNSKLDDKIIELCNMVVYESYIEINDTKKKRRHLDYMTEQLKIAIEKIFKYEDYDEEVLKEYLEVHSQIQKDISSLYQLYKLSKEEAWEIVKRIEENIKLQNKEYFIKQKYIIGLFDSLHECGIIDSFKSGLIEIAETLYEPKLGEKPIHFNIDDYNVYDVIDGEQTNYNVYFIINYINKYNKNCYNILINDMLNNRIKEKDINGIYDVLQYHDTIQFEVFTEIYEFAFDMLKKEYNEVVWNLLCRIISKADTNLVNLFLKREIKNNKFSSVGIITKIRLKRLFDIVNENQYFEWQAEQYRELQEEQQE